MLFLILYYNVFPCENKAANCKFFMIEPPIAVHNSPRGGEINVKKTLLILLGVLALTGCTSDADMNTATQSPTATQSASPSEMPFRSPEVSTDPGAGIMDGMTDGLTDSLTDGMDMTPGATDMPESTGVTSIDKAGRIVEQIEDELERLSEVDDAQVIIAGNKAAVALEFDDQYLGGIDDRLRGIVKERIDSVISGVKTIAITTDENILEAIESLGDRLDTVSDMNALQQDVDAVIRKINGAAA